MFAGLPNEHGIQPGSGARRSRDPLGSGAYSTGRIRGSAGRRPGFVRMPRQTCPAAPKWSANSGSGDDRFPALHTLPDKLAAAAVTGRPQWVNHSIMISPAGTFQDYNGARSTMCQVASEFAGPS